MLALIRGAGDIASGAAMRLWRCGIDVVMTDLARPTAIRRTVAFSNAIVHGETTVEGLRAVRAENAAEAKKLLREGSLPVLADPECACREELAPDALVDAILAKRNLGTKIDDAPIVVGVGPGFTAGEDCHAVVETMRGHTLGRVIYSGSALPNTNIPGLIGGFAGERVLRAPCDGIFTAVHRIGDTVEEGETIGFVEGQRMKCTISGVLRGVLDDGVPVKKGMKSGDVDPRGKRAVSRYRVISSDHQTSVLALNPVTGRTHQLRLHCKAAGFPILGDPQYCSPASALYSGTQGLFCQQLLAARLELTHPVMGQPLVISSRQSVSAGDEQVHADARVLDGNVRAV